MYFDHVFLYPNAFYILPTYPTPCPFFSLFILKTSKQKSPNEPEHKTIGKKHKEHTPKLKQTNKHKAHIITNWETIVYKQKISRTKIKCLKKAR